VAGVCYSAQTLLGLWQPQQEQFQSLSDYWIELFFIAALLGTLGGLLTLRSRHVGKMSRLFTVGLAVAAAGVGGLVISAVATLLLGQNALGLLFVTGLLTTIVGNLLLGSAIIRSKLLPAWLGLLLVISWPLSMALADFGGLLVGSVWLAIAGQLQGPGADKNCQACPH
jgi:hypothetical protein